MERNKYSFNELKKTFDEANILFLENNKQLFENKVSERCMCGALMLELSKSKKNIIENDLYCDDYLTEYFVDVEYNRNIEKCKTIVNDECNIIKVTCDIIMHSRGRNINQDNLIAIEMKKHKISKSPDIDDYNRLRALTKPLTENAKLNNYALPVNVCGYSMGVYYIVDTYAMVVKILYFQNGEECDSKYLDILKPRKIKNNVVSE